jgi:hypothetical protein
LREGETAEIKLGSWGDGRRSRVKVLKPPEKFLMLGDVLELWDATDRGVDLDSRPIFNLLEKLNCEKIYILGNHDYDLKPYVGTYPSGETKLRIFEEYYPVQDGGDYSTVRGEQRKVSTLRVGDRDYLFVHGYQFDRIFRYQPWKLFPNIRSGALAFGSYGNLFVGLLALSAAVAVFDYFLLRYYSVFGFLGLSMSFLGSLVPIFSVLGNTALILLWLVLGFPRIFYLYARGVWNRVAGTRYNHRASVRGILSWWGRFSKGRVVNSNDLRVVYGHTHLIDVINSDELNKAKVWGKDVNITAVNVPAWVKDYTRKGWGILTDVCLYIDEEDELFIGWDGELQRPFYVPLKVVDERIKNGTISKETGKKLVSIGWPQTMVDVWTGERKFHEVRAKDLKNPLPTF